MPETNYHAGIYTDPPIKKGMKKLLIILYKSMDEELNDIVKSEGYSSKVELIREAIRDRIRKTKPLPESSLEALRI